MKMYRLKIIILTLLFGMGGYWVLAQTKSDSIRFAQLSELANASINVGNSKSIDSMLLLCDELEPVFESGKERFVLKQIRTNALGMKGDMQQAVALAEQVYKEAEGVQNKQILALALQTLGDTYFHTGQYQRALSLFEKAQQGMEADSDSVLVVRLLFQQIHSALSLKDTLSAAACLSKTEVYRRPILANPAFRSTLLCYETMYDILVGDISRAAEKIDVLQASTIPEGTRKLYLHLLVHFRIANGQYPEAEELIDSILLKSDLSGNGIELRNVIQTKAHLFEWEGNLVAACKAYEEVKNISDSINIQRYTKSLESLRLSYTANQMKLENISAHHKLIVQIFILVCVALLIAIVLIVLFWRKNILLKKSRRELQKNKEAAEASIYTKSLFLSNMSHDLRAPLGAIVGFANLLSDSGEVDDELRIASGGYIKQNSELLLKLVHDIEDFSALSENKMKFNFGACDVIQLCKNVIDTVKRVNKADIELFFVPQIDELTIETDHIRLQQVLINLLVNSTKFTKTGFVKLIVRKDEERGEAVFVVEDTGCGIPLHKQPHIFERFEKLHEGAQGVGLGLSICQLIVESVGGKIWIDPDYTDGARFVFTHPFNQKQTL